MSRGCQKYETLIDKRAGGLSVSEQLQLEQHVATCPACLRTLRTMEQVTDSLRSASSSLSESARMRAVSRALDHAGRDRLAPVHSRSWWLGGGLAAAAALLIGWAGLYGLHQEQAAVSSVPPRQESAPAAAPKVEEKRAPAASTQDAWVFADASQEHTFGHARVRLEKGTRARFDAASSTLSLAAGALDVDVDARAGQRFTVLTDSFRVEVLGTQFRVTREQVVVKHGLVRVSDLAGKVLVPALSAGESFRAGQEEKPAADRHRPKLQLLLSRAREALSQNDVERARSLIGEAERARPTRREAAEAMTLKAECAMLQRDTLGAAKLYEHVAKRYPELPAGENAAFAAAQLYLRSSDKGRAQKQLEAYVARYPRGRFVEEARARLSAFE